MVREPDMSGPAEATPAGPGGVDAEGSAHGYLDEDGNTYYLADDGTAYYLDEEGKPYYIAEDGNAYYFTGDEPAEEAAETDDDATVRTAAPKKRRDPIVQLLGVGVFLLVVVGLAAAGSMIWYMLGMRGAPRTAVERNIATYESAVEENPKDAEGYLKLAYAYIEGDRFGDAREIIARGQKIKKVPAFELALADMMREEGRYEDAIKAYSAAEVSERKKLDELKKKAEKESITLGQDNTRLVAILMGRGQAYEDSREWTKALADYKKCEGMMPLDVEILSAVGRAEMAMGNKDKAKVAFETALKYVPDHREAQKGLEQLGGK